MTPDAGERQEESFCVVCGSEESFPYWDCGDFGFHRCRNCGHIFQNPRPVFDDLKERYQDEYFEYELENDAPFFDLMRRGLDDIDFDAIEASMPEAARALDIGCATGMLVEHLAARGWQAEGVEICVPAAMYGWKHRHIPIRTGTLDDQAYEDGRFDFVHFSHVIEHVPDPRAFLEEVARITRPGGYVVIVTPNTRSLQALMFGSQWRSAIADHLNLFSSSSLERLMSETGFSVMRTKTWGGIAEGLAPGWVKRPVDRLAKPFGYGDVVLKLGRRSS